MIERIETEKVEEGYWWAKCLRFGGVEVVLLEHGEVYASGCDTPYGAPGEMYELVAYIPPPSVYPDND